MSVADKTSEPPSVGVNGCPVGVANRRGDKNQQFFGYKPQDEIVCDALSGEAPVRALWPKPAGPEGAAPGRGCRCAARCSYIPT